MRRPTHIALGLLLTTAATLAACSNTPGRSASYGPSGSPTGDDGGLFGRGTAVVTGDGDTYTLEVEIADTDLARATGLMHRTSLAPDAGMAFLFDEPAKLSFYMKETLIPLSIAFWDPDGRVVGVFEMLPCASDPCPLTTSPEPAIGALEMNAGWFDRHAVRVGDRITVRRSGG